MKASQIVVSLLLLCDACATEGWTFATQSSHGLDIKNHDTKMPMAVMTRRRKLFTAAVAFSAGSLFAASPKQSLARNLPQSTGADTSNTGSIATLIPIVQLRTNLCQLQSDVVANSKTPSHSLPPIPKQLPRDETSFKRILDAFSDPVSYKQKYVDSNAFLVYYSKGYDGPGRPSIEEGLPVKQTLQYGSRNDAWVAWEEVLSEYDFAQEQQQKGGEEWDPEDMTVPLKRAVSALDAYMALAPKEDLLEAQKQAMVGNGSR